MGDQSAPRRVLPPFKRAVNEEDNKLSLEGSSAPDTNFEYAFFGISDHQEAVAGFKIIFADGNMAAIYYHDIVSPIRFDRAGTIELSIFAFTLKIAGKHLKVLFDYFFENQVIWIKEPDTTFVQVEEGQPEIETIKLEPKG